MTTTESPRTRDEAQVRQLIADQQDAICENLDQIMAPTQTDAVMST